MLLDRIKNSILEQYGKESLLDFESLRLREISIDKSKSTVLYTISTPVALSIQRETELKNCIKEFSPSGFKIKLDMPIDKMDAEIATRMFWDFLKDACPSVYMELYDDRDSVLFEDRQGRVAVTFKVKKKVNELLNSGALSKIEKYFKDFTSVPFDYFINEIQTTEVDIAQSLSYLDKERERTVEAYMSQPERKIFLEDQKAIIGKLPNISPQYVIDVISSQQTAYVCGKFSNFTKRESKNKDMTICKFTVQDFSGTINVVYFAKSEKNLSAILNLYSGDEVVVYGKPQMNSYDNRLEILANSVGICKVAKQRYNLHEYKPVPPEYVKVSPMPYLDTKQEGVFEVEKTLPKVLANNVFVVFDLETTGLQPQLHKIIEIGAVKLVGGKITETFTTLINPQTKIPSDITRLNGIDDEMVKDKPIFAEVCGDFYKFAHDAILVAHNASFDYSMLDYHARPCGYLFNNTIVDTLALTSKFFENVPKKQQPKDEKLITLAKHFEFEMGDFHRAMFDTFTTSKLLVKLLTDKEGILDLN